jgi:[histone H3]-lysine36 N-trimethyltransferase
MSKWPLIARNKVDDSKISEPVQRCTNSDNESLKNAAQKVISLSWRVVVTYWTIYTAA